VRSGLLLNVFQVLEIGATPGRLFIGDKIL
jgi:hypothetical protein